MTGGRVAYNSAQLRRRPTAESTVYREETRDLAQGDQGQIPNSLGQLVGRPEAIECDLELRRGVTVDVSGEYTEEQLRLLYTPRRGE